MPLKIVRNDITKMEVDAIVNTANEDAIFSSGVDYAVYKEAGESELLALRKKIGKKNCTVTVQNPVFSVLSYFYQSEKSFKATLIWLRMSPFF